MGNKLVPLGESPSKLPVPCYVRQDALGRLRRADTSNHVKSHQSGLGRVLGRPRAASKQRDGRDGEKHYIFVMLTRFLVRGTLELSCRKLVRRNELR